MPRIDEDLIEPPKNLGRFGSLCAIVLSQPGKEAIVLMLGAFGLIYETFSENEPRAGLDAIFAGMCASAAGIGAYRHHGAAVTEREVAKAQAPDKDPPTKGT